jgi:methyl-accepting chemotaxis protein
MENPLFNDMSISKKLISGFLVLSFLVAVTGIVGVISLKKVHSASETVVDEKAPIAATSLTVSIAINGAKDAVAKYLLLEDPAELATVKENFEDHLMNFEMYVHAMLMGTDSETFRSSSHGVMWAEEHANERVIALSEDSEVRTIVQEMEDAFHEFKETSYIVISAHEEKLALLKEEEQLVKDLKTNRKIAEKSNFSQGDAQLKFEYQRMGYLDKEYLFQYLDQKHADRWLSSITLLKESVLSSGLDADSKTNALNALDEYESIALRTIPIINTISRIEGVQKARLKVLDETSMEVSELMKKSEELSRAEMISATTNAESVMSKANYIMILATIAAVGLGIWLGVMLSRKITRPLYKLISYSKVISSGDLTKNIRARTKDELGELYGSFGSMLDNLRDLIIQVQGSSQRVAATSQEFAASSEEMTASTTQVSTTLQQIAAGAQGQSRQVAKASEEVKRISEMAQKISSTAESIALVTDNTNRVAKEGGDAAKDAAAKMEEIQKSVDQSAVVVKALDERSKRIGEIVDVITNIAEQTNLLALNAAIEAARAGEQGKGFAVVAEEVRKLAEGSARAAEEISGLIQSIQGETMKAVESMESGSKEVSEGVEIVDKALSALNNIASGVEEISKWFQEISSATQEQTALTESITKGMDKVATKAEEAAAGTEEASAAAEEQTASMEEISSSAQELSNLALQLQEATSRFKVNGAAEPVAEKGTKIEEFSLNDVVNKVPEVTATNGGKKRL